MKSVVNKNFYQLILVLLIGLSSQLSAEPQEDKKEAYRLRVGDYFKLTAFAHPDLTKSFTIDQTGNVFIPMVEEAIPLKGLTLKEATQKILQSFPKNKANLRISLEILKFAQHFAEVRGEVNAPGPIHLPPIGSIDLATALASAGGLSLFADPDAIEFVTADGVSETWTWAELKDAKRKKPMLNAGDQIVVSQSPLAKTSVRVDGRVKKRGFLAIPENGNLDLATALLRSGGLGSSADQSRIELIPADGSPPSIFGYDAIWDKENLKGSAGKTLLKPGDRVRVHESPPAALGRKKVKTQNREQKGERDRLQAGDEISMEVLGEPDLSIQKRIDRTGKLVVPLIGQVDAQGHSIAKLEEILETEYRKGYLVNPKIRVMLSENVARVPIDSDELSVAKVRFQEIKKRYLKKHPRYLSALHALRRLEKQESE